MQMYIYIYIYANVYIYIYIYIYIYACIGISLYMDLYILLKINFQQICIIKKRKFRNVFIQKQLPIGHMYSQNSIKHIRWNIFQK